MADTGVMTNALTRPLIRVATLAALAGAALPAPAQAWWRGGVFIGIPPVVVGAPVVAYPPPYYYPPAYYAPGVYAAPAYGPPPYPPAQSPAPQLLQTNTPLGSTCYAGNYVCAAPSPTPVGAGCSCPGLGAPSYGLIQ